MYAVERLSSYISRGVYTVSGPFHPFGGAVDIIVVEQQDGSFKSSPWYVRFGKFQGVLKTKEKIIDISVNGVETGLQMYLDHKGEAYFLKEVDGGGEDLGDSVLYQSSSGDETDEQSCNRMLDKSQSCDFGVDEQKIVKQIDLSNGKVVSRSNSRRSRILGLMFGRRTTVEDRLREEESDDGLSNKVMTSPLERAELAADLLEMKWSTNLATGKSRKDDSTSQFSALETTAGEVDRESRINGGESQGSSFVDDEVGKNGLDHSLLCDETASLDGDVGKSCDSGSEKSRCSVEESVAQMTSLSMLEQDVEMCNLGDGELEGRCNFVPITSENASARDFDHDENSKDVIFENSSPHKLIPNQSELEASPSKQLNVEEVFDKNVVVLQGRSMLKDNGTDRVTSFLYCKTSQSSRLKSDDSSGETHDDTSYISSENCDEVHVHAEAVHVSEVHSLQEPDVLLTNELSNNRLVLRDSDGSNFIKDAKILESEERTSMNTTRSSVVAESVSLVDIQSITCNAVNNDMFEVIHQDTTITEMVAEKINLKTEEVKIVENHFQHKNPQIISVDPVLGSVDQAKLKRSFTYSACDDNSSDPVSGEENHMADTDMSVLHPSSASVKDSHEFNFDCVLEKAKNISPSEGSEEENPLLSDLADFNPIGVHITETTSSCDSMEKESHPLLMLGGFEGEDKLVDTTNYPCDPVLENLLIDSEELIENPRLTSSPINIPRSRNSANTTNYPCDPVLENLLNNSEELIENPRLTSSTISIPRSRNSANEEVGHLVKSLPNIWSNADCLDLLHLSRPLGHSLDSNSESLNWTLCRNDTSNHVKSDTEKEYQLTQEQPTGEGNQISMELENLTDRPRVDISLCKHLLYEGMGREAASQAFDSEKLDVDKFASLGSAVIKNDRLVVRISDHYFAWDTAAPIILGMVSFGSEKLIEPKGMIAVDQVKETHDGDPSKSVINRSGSWRIWPFSFKRSRTKKASQPTLNGSRTSDVENASESSVGMGGDKYVSKSDVTRKRIRTVTPTSEQLASLNLKEGRNIVTFTFSTTVLGKQQVDARIYLWKWNTHIVISDVDGTITKSDVLGQFMPLVGYDWSQTGVAHLFSAIKENGYQLLFLSARAISQAYHTRQFLINLKQDGKVLPDGPVVISPDGLFPSLFREVIRRAPHEFKIACLEDIKALFPSDCNPFYAGFGNRDTDEISYVKVGIPKGKIFIINPKGEVAVNRRVDTKSYTSLHALVNGMFPPMSSSEPEDYNSWNFWRLPPPTIDV